MGLRVSVCCAKAILSETFPPLPTNPKTRMNIKGNAILKITADGLLNTAFRLARVMANIALN